MEQILVKVDKDIVHLRKLYTGKKQSVILVHGLGTSGSYYVKYAEKLASYYNVYIIDLPGYGKSRKPRTALTIEQLSRILQRFVVEYGIKNSIIVGQSMGCQVAAHTIATSPGLFEKIIFLSPTVNINERSVRIQGFRLLQDMLHEPIVVNIIVFSDYARMGIGRYLTTSRYMIDDQIERVINSITLPVLIVRGSKDKIVPRKWVEYLADITPRAQITEIASARHLLQYSKPDDLTQVTRKFIEE